MNKFPEWSQLYSISKNKYIKSSYFWFIAVPIAARLISVINSKGYLNWLGFCQFELPFTWQLFYFGATFIAAGNLIYSARCPDILRSFKSYSDFNAKGQSGPQLLSIYKDYIVKVYYKDKDPDIVKNLITFYKNFCAEDVRIDERLKSRNPNLAVILSKLKINPDDLNGAFGHVTDVAQKMHKLSKALCCLLYLAGMFLIGWVFFIQNTWRVLQTTYFYGYLNIDGLLGKLWPLS